MKRRERPMGAPGLHHATRASAVVVACAWMAAACGAQVTPPDAANTSDVATLDASPGADALTTDALTTDVPTTDALAADAPVAVTGHGAVLYLNFNGGISFTLEGPHAGNEVWVPAFIQPTGFANGETPPFVATAALSDGWQARRAALIDDTRARLEAIVAPFDLRVVTDRPATRADIEIFVGGDDTNFGRAMHCTDRLGFAPLVCGTPAPDEHRRGHTLGRCLHTGDDAVELARNIAAISAHEMGHSLSLEHVDDPHSLMYYQGTSGEPRWGAGTVVGHGHEMAEWLDCRTGFQDNTAELTARLGTHRARPPVVRATDVTAPTIVRVVPADGSAVPPGTRPCIEATDNDAIEYAYFEAYVAVRSVDGFVLLGEAGAGDAPYQFDFATPAAGEYVYRFTLTDRSGNLTEVHNRVRIDPSAPPPAPCR